MGPNMSSLAVTRGGSCTRIMRVGSNEHDVRHVWALHARGLHLTTTLYKQGRKGKVGKKPSSYPAATEDALCEMAFQKAEEAIKGTRDAHERKVRKQGGTTPAVSSRWMGADRAMTSCLVLAAIAASQVGRVTRSSASATPAAPVADPEVRLFCMSVKCAPAGHWVVCCTQSRQSSV